MEGVKGFDEVVVVVFFFFFWKLGWRDLGMTNMLFVDLNSMFEDMVHLGGGGLCYLAWCFSEIFFHSNLSVNII